MSSQIRSRTKSLSRKRAGLGPLALGRASCHIAAGSQIHTRVVRGRLRGRTRDRAARSTAAGRGRANMGRQSLGHTDLLRDIAGRQFSSDALDARLDALIDTLFDHLHDRPGCLLLLLLLLHLLKFVVVRDHVLAVETNGLRHRAQHFAAALEPHNVHISRIVRGLQELDLTLPDRFSLDSDVDALNRDPFLAGQDARRVRKHDQVGKLHQRRLHHVAIDIRAHGLQNFARIAHQHGKPRCSASRAATASLTADVFRDRRHVIRNLDQFLISLHQLLDVARRHEETDRRLAHVAEGVITNVPALPRVEIIRILAGRHALIVHYYLRAGRNREIVHQ